MIRIRHYSMKENIVIDDPGGVVQLDVGDFQQIGDRHQEVLPKGDPEGLEVIRIIIHWPGGQ